MVTAASEHRPVPTFEVEHATDGQMVMVKRSDYDWLAGEMGKLRKAYIKLQADIGSLIPPVDGERANDPIIERVRRVVAEGQAQCLPWIPLALKRPAQGQVCLVYRESPQRVLRAVAGRKWAGGFCDGDGDTGCAVYDVSHWLPFTPPSEH